LNGEIRALPGKQWLLDRIRLFEARCFPTVANQTNQDFRWLIFFDPETPEEGLAELRRIIGDRPNIHLRFCPIWTKSAFVAAIRDTAAAPLQWLLSTRLDNDDGWHEQFVDRLQAEVRPGVREFLNFSSGYIVSGGRTYLYRHPSNAFISLSEAPEPIDTPFAISHERLGELAPIRQIDDGPAFYQMVHGGNFSNKVRGVRVATARAQEQLGNLRFALDDARAETAWLVPLENLTIGTARAARDGLINLAKRLLKRSSVTAGTRHAA
jgi:hypothetical protein